MVPRRHTLGGSVNDLHFRFGRRPVERSSLEPQAARLSFTPHRQETMLIFRGDALGVDSLREILETIARHFHRRMVLARWDDGETTSYMITMDDTLVARSPAYVPLAMASPDGVAEVG